MCGRFTQQLTWCEIHDLYRLAGSALPINLAPRYNGAPTQGSAQNRANLYAKRFRVGACWIGAAGPSRR